MTWRKKTKFYRLAITMTMTMATILKQKESPLGIEFSRIEKIKTRSNSFTMIKSDDVIVALSPRRNGNGTIFSKYHKIRARLKLQGFLTKIIH